MILSILVHGVYFNPRSPHGERRHLYGNLSRFWHFNPRSPHGERRGWCCGCCSPCNFNPRSPHGERHHKMRTNTRLEDFNPRSPHGERPRGRLPFAGGQGFQSTLPARGATFAAAFQPRAGNISIHAPRTGSDMRARWTSCLPKHFNPRSPHGERQQCLLQSNAA